MCFCEAEAKLSDGRKKRDTTIEAESLRQFRAVLRTLEDKLEAKETSTEKECEGRKEGKEVRKFSVFFSLFYF